MQRRWFYHAAWRGIGLTFWVLAKNETEAAGKAERQVLRMQGGMSCMELRFIRVEELD